MDYIVDNVLDWAPQFALGAGRSVPLLKELKFCTNILQELVAFRL